MDILIIHLGSISDNIIASSIVKSIHSQYKDPKIYWVVKGENSKNVFKYNKNIHKAITIEEFVNMNNKNWNIFINLHPGFSKEDCNKISSNNKMGFFNNNDEDLSILYSLGKTTSMSSIQIYHRLIGKKWKGSGYDIGYFPKTKSNPKRAGIFISNMNLKHYCLSNLYHDSMKSNALWVIPFKKNLFKKMDEINRCGSVITDDLTTMHLSIYLRKYVYFLETLPQSTRYEFFGRGQTYVAPISIIR